MAKQTLRVASSVAALLLALFVLGVSPAMAGDKGGKSDKGAGSGYTEDTDTNDNGTPNNVSDTGDNAHPSGKDRSIEKGGSGTQGKSGSDPDGDSNGGPDKANGSGGVDKADQDGNNGCGNDDDFEDDNNGNCGPKDKDKVKADSCTKAKGKGKGLEKKCEEDEVLPTETETPDDEVKGGSTSEPCVEDATMAAGDSKDCDEATEDDVLGAHIENDSDEPEDDVLGTTLSNDDDVAAGAAERESGAALPFTGAQLLSILALAGGLVGSGYLFMRKDRS